MEYNMHAVVCESGVLLMMEGKRKKKWASRRKGSIGVFQTEAEGRKNRIELEYVAVCRSDSCRTNKTGAGGPRGVV